MLLIGSMLGTWGAGGIGPRMPGLHDVRAVLRTGLPYLCFGVGAWLLGNIDILLGRFAHPPDEVGVLQVGTMAVRGLGLIPWVAATLMLRPLHEAWFEGRKPTPYRWLFMGVGLGLLVAAFALLVMPLLAQGHAVPVSSVQRSTWAACLFAPALYPMILLTPISGAWNLRGTLKAFGLGLIAACAAATQAVDMPEISSCVLVAGTGQLVTVMWLIRALRSPREEYAQMGPGTGRPGVGSGGIVGESLQSSQFTSLHHEE
jgi:O-antigen/teichoic acid export membrane protein